MLEQLLNSIVTVFIRLLTHFLNNLQELGCCWDVTKTSHCFSASADSRKSSEEHTAGFAAGITAMVFILMYAAVGGVYYFVKK